MAEYSTTPQLVITDTFSTLVTDFNTVSSGLGATGDLLTNVKTSIVGAINEIEGVFDASEFGISAGSTAFDITTTNASGISLAAPITSLTGNLSLVDNKEIRVGTGDDLIVLHDATNSIIKGDSIYIKAKSADENMASFTYNGAVNLYHDAISRLATTAGGVSIPNDVELGATSVIKSGGTAAITFANADVTMGGDITIAGTVDGRDVSVDGTKLDTVETNADVTDTANVTAAGALMDSELASIADVKALDQSVISGASPTFGTANFTDATNKRLMTDAQETKLDSVETNADVTDTENVTSAGALMDSELTDLAGVKGVTISTLQVKPSEGAFANGDKTKLDAIEPGATADQTAAEIRALVESATNSNVFTNADHTKLDGIETSATADQTDAEIKTAYENNSDTNAFTDDDHTKLDGIETGATADQTASQILTKVKTVDGASSGLDADLLDGQHGSYYGTASAVSTNSTAIGTLTSLSSDIDVDRTNLVAAINELQGDINQINSNGASANNTIIGTLTQMLTSEDSDVVGAINELHTETLANTTKLSGIEAGANVTDTANVFASLVEGDGIDLDSSSGTISSALVTATSSALGLVKIGYTLDGANRNYPVELSSGQMYVNVPWNADTDTNTQNQYSTSVVSSSGIKLRLSGTGHNGSTTDDVKFVGAGSSTVSRTDASTITITSIDTNTQRAIHDTPVNGATTTSISSNWAFDNVKTAVPSGAVFTDNNTQLSNEQVQDIVGGMLGGTETGITVTYQDGTGDIDFVVASQTQNDFTNTLKSKLDAISAGAEVNRTAAATLTLIKTVDGAGSGLDADLLDGQSSAHYATAASVPLVFNAAGSQLN